MTTATVTIPDLSAATPEEVDRKYKAAFVDLTPAGAKQPPREILAKLGEAQRVAHEALVKARDRGTSTPRTPKSIEGTVWSRNGKPLSRHSLSFAAWAVTKGIGGESVERIGTAALRELIVKAGVAEPETSSFAVVLPNGVTLSAEVPDKPLSAAHKALVEKASKPAAKPAASKATTAKAAAPKASAKPTTKLPILDGLVNTVLGGKPAAKPAAKPTASKPAKANGKAPAKPASKPAAKPAAKKA